MKNNLFTSSRLLVLMTAVMLAGCSHKNYSSLRSYRPEAGAYGRGVQQTAVQQNTPPAAVPTVPLRTPLQLRIDSILTDHACQTFQTGISIYDLTEGLQVYAQGEHQRMRPASSEKMVTAIAALDLLGPEYQLRTRLCSAAPIEGGHLKGDLWVVGAMDPLVDKAVVQSLVSGLRQAGIQAIDGQIRADLGLKDSNRWGWGWCWDDKNPVLTPLLCEGREGFEQVLMDALRGARITFRSPQAPKSVDASSFGCAFAQGAVPADAVELAAVGHSLSEVMVAMMKDSHNLSAECVFYQLGTLTGSRGAGRRQVGAYISGVIQRAAAAFPSLGASLAGSTLTDLSSPFSSLSQVADGSGLSLYNYQTAEVFCALLHHAALNPQVFQTLMQVLPVAAVDGTLKNRMIGTAAASNIHAKTGTVEGVSSLVGYAQNPRTGHLYAFAILSQGTSKAAMGRALQDQICIALCE